MISWTNNNNIIGIDFNLYSTLNDTLNEVNEWCCCNYNDPGIGAFRDCGPDSLQGGCQFGSNRTGCGRNVRFSIYTRGITKIYIL